MANISKPRRQQKVVAQPAQEEPRPAPRRWQIVCLVFSAILLIAWLGALSWMAWK
ncbi:MAG TPA: hypothetical protein VMJ32_03100 [Pirellulales bacterium]|nr:hypothetical protein [Pirellulales bacterium]